MTETATALSGQVRHDLTLTRLVACPECASYTFRVTFTFVGDVMLTSGRCLSCGFERGSGDPKRSALENAAVRPDRGQVDTPSSL